MENSRCLYLVPSLSMLEYTKRVLKAEKLDIIVEHGILQSAVEMVREYLPKGIEVVVARGKTSRAVTDANLGVSVVELPITAFDLLYAMDKAKVYGNKVAVVAFQSMVLGIESVARIMGVDIGFFFIDKGEETEAVVAKAISEGYNVILGGTLTVTAAKALKVPAAFIESGKESILQAAYEALRVGKAIEKEKYKREMFAAVVDYASDGIITVDTEGIITSINPRASKITKFKNAIGYNIKTLWPGLQLDKTMKNHQPELNQIVELHGTQVYCSKLPVMVNGHFGGAVVNFQEISRIQQLEASIRKEIYAKGHIARMTFENIWGNSLQINKAIEMAKEYAITDSNILLLGETGTGKEVFAQSIHNHSIRKKGPFVAVNCAALPSQLLESELFGYVKGAFTGANKEGKPGLFELAHGGTIFLDEIAELDYVNQGRLLRVLQERTVVRLGSDTVVPVNVRIIAATNKDLNMAVSEKTFRDDLFYRLNVLKLALPPLRERKSDIKEYANKYMEYYTTFDTGKNFSKGAVKLLERFDWPGNIRQLQNTIQRVSVLSKNKMISEAEVAQCLDMIETKTNKTSLAQEIDEILEALKKAKGKQSEAAKILGINRSTLWRKMQRLGI